MRYRHIPAPPQSQIRAEACVATAYPESPRSRAVMAIGMLCVPLVSFGSVLSLYLILTV
jgi:hypothetical protein